MTHRLVYLVDHSSQIFASCMHFSCLDCDIHSTNVLPHLQDFGLLSETFVGGFLDLYCLKTSDIVDRSVKDAVDEETAITTLKCSDNNSDFKGRKEMFYLTTHSTHFIYGYMSSDIWLRTILIVRKETRCHHIGYSYRFTARVLLYAPSHRQDSTYHGLCYTSRGALAGTRNSSMGSPHEGSIRRPIAP